MLILFSALSKSEQEEVAGSINELRMRRLAGDKSAPARYVRSLRAA